MLETLNCWSVGSLEGPMEETLWTRSSHVLMTTWYVILSRLISPVFPLSSLLGLLNTADAEAHRYASPLFRRH